MSPETLNEDLIRKYLLGAVSLEDRERIEDAYFADSETLEAIVAAENDLIDSYARGSLTDEERQDFEQRYTASTDMSARVAFARVLAQIMESEKKTASPNRSALLSSIISFFHVPHARLSWAFAALLLVGVSVLSLQNHNLRRQLRDVGAEALRTHQENGALRSQVAALSGKPQLQRGEETNQITFLEPPAELAFGLVSGSTRGATVGKELVLPRNGGWVRLEMVLDRDEFSDYEAVLQTAEGKDVLQAKGLKSTSIRGDRVVVWWVQASLIRPGDYALRLSGDMTDGTLEEAQAYSFRAVRK